MILLESGQSSCEIDELGAYVKSLTLQDQEILKVSTDGNPTHGGSAVLIPYAGRVRNAIYSYGGTVYHLPQNDERNSIHGFLKDSTWDIVHATGNKVELGYTLSHSGYPSTILADITYELLDNVFNIEYRVKNVGDKPVPLVVGSHPYFVIKNTWRIRYSETLKMLNYVDRYFPDGTYTDVNLSVADDLSTCKFDNCYSGGGDIELYSEGRAITIRRNNMPYFVLYNDKYAGTDSVAIEPMSGAPDSFNNGIGLIDLHPNSSFSCGFGIILEK